MPVVVQHVYVAQCQWCDWESVGKLTESAATGVERTHVAHAHGAHPWRSTRRPEVVEKGMQPASHQVPIPTLAQGMYPAPPPSARQYTDEMRAADDANGCYRCPTCLRGFWTKRGLTLHALSHNPTVSEEDR